MDLVPYIYCEKQEPGSMLCAQHALNNLLQSHIWSPDNLADIARKLDSIESSHLDQNQSHGSSRTHTSSNYDDSGFFSVQVIDDALHPLGLRIISWKSEEMKPMHDYPENQEAFILNHDLHWFTLRRFGQSVDRWYNLNSMAEDSPKWIGPTFLSMSIAQAEAEGYSIFAVIPLPPTTDPSAPQPGRLIACEADEQAQLLDQLGHSSLSGQVSSGSSSSLRRPREEEIKDPTSSSRTRMKLEDDGNQIEHLTYEDQLRIAIEASLTQNSSTEVKKKSTKNDQNPEENKISSTHGLNTCGIENRPKVDSSTNNLPDSSSINGSIKAAKPDKSSSGTSSNIAQDFGSLEDKELALAISQSLLHSPKDLTPAVSHGISDQTIDEPTPDELRQKRLARFSSSS